MLVVVVGAEVVDVVLDVLLVVGGGAVVVVDSVVLVVMGAATVVVVVVVGFVAGQPSGEQASQQLGQTLAAPPASVHAATSRSRLHFCVPFAVSMQQVTKPGFPQTDFAAHRRTDRLQLPGSAPVAASCFATFVAHRT